jgi:hypothetical protein
MHWFKKYGKTMKNVRNDVAALMGSNTSNSTTTTTESTSSKSQSVDVTYKVKAGGKWLPAVKNLSDYAGKEKDPITDVAIKVSKGNIRYRVHVRGGKWLSYVTGYNTNDHANGYAGNGKAIDAIQIIYDGTKKAYYRVSPINSATYYSYQPDNDTSGGKDGYAGKLGTKIDKLQIYIK